VTGGNAAQHGIPSNRWFDRASRREIYCMEDRRHPVLGVPAHKGEGRSPANLASSTVGDELVLATGGRSRVFSVSIKDRAAIAMGGHLGKAFWYHEATGRMVTSSFYYDAYPDWVREWNAGRPADGYLREIWELLLDPDTYVFRGQDDRPAERPEEGLGRTFPHDIAADGAPPNYAALPNTPFGDRLTLDFVEALMEAERLGRRGSTDILAVSFSVTDYIGHAFGPFSLEAEDNFLRLDATLAQLFRFVDRSVGLDNTLVLITSDHGVAPIPEFLAEHGLPAGRLDAPQLVSDAERALRSGFPAAGEVELKFESPGIYLDHEALAVRAVDVAAVERYIAEQVSATPGIRAAFTRSDLLSGRYPDTAEARGVLASFHPQRSGNVILVAEPFWHLSGEPNGSAATHGSMHAYDTHVPIMLAGPGVRQAVVHRRVAARDVALTLSTYLGTAPPSGAVGAVLPGAIE
jgi:hypothetical protein